MLQLICSIWSLYDDTLQYATICLFSDNSLHYRYVFIKHGKCKQTLTPSSRYSHKYMTKCQQTTWLVEACLQNVNKQRDWSRRAYDQWRFLMNNRWSGELQDLSLQNERFTWARVSQTMTRWIYIYQFSPERSDGQHRAMSTWDVTLPERVATKGSHNTLTWGEQRVSTWAVNKQIYLFI